MEQANFIKKDARFEKIVTRQPGQADIWMPGDHIRRRIDPNVQRDESQQSVGFNHARKAYRRLYQQACDQFKRADRDLGETAAFVAASLTTATAIEAVMTVANDKLGLSKDILQEGFYVYIGIFVLILLYGVLRGKRAIQRRAKAEKEIDEAKEGIFRYYPDEQWPKFEE